MRMQVEGFTVLPLIIGEYNREIKEGLLSFEEATERAEKLSKKQGIPVGVYIPVARFEPQVPSDSYLMAYVMDKVVTRGLPPEMWNLSSDPVRGLLFLTSPCGPHFAI